MVSRCSDILNGVDRPTVNRINLAFGEDCRTAAHVLFLMEEAQTAYLTTYGDYDDDLSIAIKHQRERLSTAIAFHFSKCAGGNT